MLDNLKACILYQLKEQCCLQTTSTDLAIQVGWHIKAVELPIQYKQFAKVFSEEESLCFPPSQPCDHMIELKKDAPDAIKCKVYPMSWTEDTALQYFLKEQLTKGYIHSLKSQYALSFFFTPRRMESYALYRTIDTLIVIPFKTSTHVPSFWTFLPTFMALTSTQNLTSDEDTTMCA